MTENTKPEVVSPKSSGIISDLIDGLQAWEIWALLGWQDIRGRYRRSVIGPFWLTISMGIMVGSLGFLYGKLFKMDIAVYLPFLSSGFIIWALISSLLIEGCNVFIDAGTNIKQIQLPLSIYIYRMTWRNLIIFFHNTIIFGAVLVIFPTTLTPALFLVIPALILILANGIWASLLFGLICARFRDVPPIMTNFIQIAFFITPILWMPDQSPTIRMLLNYNPFYHFLQILRGPLLGSAPDFNSWIMAIGTTLLGWIIALFFFSRFKKRIAFWV